MSISRRALLGIGSALSAAAMLAACSSSSTSGGAGSDAGSSSDAVADAKLPVTVTHKFGETEVKAPAGGKGLQVVALGWSDAEVCLALGVKPIGVYDWLGFGADHKGVGPWAEKLFGDVKPEVFERSADGIDYELVQSLAPDLILNVNSGYDEAEYTRLAEIAPTISGPVDALNFAPGWDNQARLIAESLGLADAGETLIEKTSATLEGVKNDHPDFAGVQAVTGSKFGEAYGLSYTGDFRWDAMEAFGFTMYSEAAKLKPENGFYADVSQEQVAVFDAPVAVLFPIGYTLAELEADPLIASLNVVKDGRAVMLDPEEELVSAFSAGNPLSITYVCEHLPQLLQEAVDEL